jgi:hypothetical protein
LLRVVIHGLLREDRPTGVRTNGRKVAMADGKSRSDRHAVTTGVRDDQRRDNRRDQLKRTRETVEDEVTSERRHKEVSRQGSCHDGEFGGRPRGRSLFRELATTLLSREHPLEVTGVRGCTGSHCSDTAVKGWEPTSRQRGDSWCPSTVLLRFESPPEPRGRKRTRRSPGAVGDDARIAPR